MTYDSAHEVQLRVRRQAELEQQAAIFVGKFKGDPGTVTALKAVLADWEANGACAALARYPSEVHDWLRELSRWAVMTLTLQATNHLLEDGESEVTA